MDSSSIINVDEQIGVVNSALSFLVYNFKEWQRVNSNGRVSLLCVGIVCNHVLFIRYSLS